MHCPPGNSVPAELAVTIQDGTAFVIASLLPEAGRSRRAGRPRGTREYGSDTDYPLKAICAVERMDIGLWRWPGVGWRTAPGTLISSEVIVWQIVALRVNVPGWSAHADGGSGVVAGVAETP